MLPAKIQNEVFLFTLGNKVVTSAKYLIISVLMRGGKALSYQAGFIIQKPLDFPADPLRGF